MSAGPPRLARLGFDDLIGFRDDDHLDAFRCFARSARLLVEGETGPRAAGKPSRALIDAARAALASNPRTSDQARRFFEARFRPFRIAPAPGFLTGYYEPLVAGSLVETDAFGWPILARPATSSPSRRARRRPGFPKASPGRGDAATAPSSPTTTGRLSNGSGATRSSGSADAVEAFLIQVQGSAQVELPDGRRVAARL